MKEKFEQIWEIFVILIFVVIPLGWFLWDQTYGVYKDNKLLQVESQRGIELDVTYDRIQTTPHLVTVKYRNSGPVDVNNGSFVYQDIHDSSFVRGAWYDELEEYMIINLKGTYYHYCTLPAFTWMTFTNARSIGSYYESRIQGNYSCRHKSVPSY